MPSKRCDLGADGEQQGENDQPPRRDGRDDRRLQTVRGAVVVGVVGVELRTVIHVAAEAVAVCVVVGVIGAGVAAQGVEAVVVAIAPTENGRLRGSTKRGATDRAVRGAGTI